MSHEYEIKHEILHIIFQECKKSLLSSFLLLTIGNRYIASK
jgi:hypothetical protein